jgi:hypothetical protein
VCVFIIYFYNAVRKTGHENKNVQLQHKVPSAAYFEVWRRMMETATVTRNTSGEGHIFHIYIHVNLMEIIFKTTHLISLATSICS